MGFILACILILFISILYYMKKILNKIKNIDKDTWIAIIAVIFIILVSFGYLLVS